MATGGSGIDPSSVIVEGCAFPWAAVSAVVSHTAQITVVLQSQNGTWVKIDRTKACPAGQIPKSIYDAACQSN